MCVFLNLLCKIFKKNMVHHLVCAMCKQLKWLQKRVKVHFPFSQETILYSKKLLERRFVNNKYLMIFIEDGIKLEKSWVS